MRKSEKLAFMQYCAELSKIHSDIQYQAITVNKKSFAVHT